MAIIMNAGSRLWLVALLIVSFQGIANERYYSTLGCACMGEYGYTTINNFNGVQTIGGCIGASSKGLVAPTSLIDANSMVCHGAQVVGNSRIENALVSGNVSVLDSIVKNSFIYIHPQANSMSVELQYSSANGAVIVPPMSSRIDFSRKQFNFAHAHIENSRISDSGDYRGSPSEKELLKGVEGDIDTVNLAIAQYFNAFNNLRKQESNKSNRWDTLIFSHFYTNPYPNANTDMEKNSRIYISNKIEIVAFNDDGAEKPDMDFSNDVMQVCKIHIKYDENHRVDVYERGKPGIKMDGHLLELKIGQKDRSMFDLGDELDLTKVEADSYQAFATTSRYWRTGKSEDSGIVSFYATGEYAAQLELNEAYDAMFSAQLDWFTANDKLNTAQGQHSQYLNTMFAQAKAGTISRYLFTIPGRTPEDTEYIARNFGTMISACQTLAAEGVL